MEVKDTLDIFESNHKRIIGFNEDSYNDILEEDGCDVELQNKYIESAKTRVYKNMSLGKQKSMQVFLNNRLKYLSGGKSG